MNRKHPSTISAEQSPAGKKRCAGWVGLGGKLAPCPELFVPHPIARRRRRFHSTACRVRTRRLQKRDFVLGDSYVEGRHTPNPDVSKKKSDAMKRAWADPEKAKRWIEAMTRAQTPDVRNRKSASMTKTLANPEVRQRYREAGKTAWQQDKGERRQQTRENAKRVFGNPEVEQRRRERFYDPSTTKKLSAGCKASWQRDNGERRQQTSERTRRFQAEQKRKLAEAWRPDDWEIKPLWWKVAGEYLLKHRDATNADLADYLHRMDIKRKDGLLWAAAMQKQSVMNDISDVRRWVRVAGRTRGRKPVNPTWH